MDQFKDKDTRMGTHGQPRQAPGSPYGGRWQPSERQPSDLTLGNDGDNSEDTWPALEYEDVSWKLPADLEGVVPITEVVRLEARTYPAAIAPAIADLAPNDHLSPATIELVAETGARITAFDLEAANLPVPMPAVLLRTESASSSQIEHLTANSRNLAAAALGAGAGQSNGKNAALVADNAAAMTRALSMDGPLTRQSLLDVHYALLNRSAPELAGQFRTGPVWIGKPDISPHGADFIPPRFERIDAAIDDLVEFASRRDINGLTLAAVAHAQLETIHPFADGNGRTGRAMVHMLLRDTGHSTHATVPVSAGLLGDVDGYFRALDSYREGDLDPIVVGFATSARRAISNGRALAADTTTIHQSWQSSIKARSDSGAWRLADALFAQPVVNSDYVQRALGSSPQGAYNAINTLVDAGVLTQSSRDRRNQLWQAKDVLDAMDAFAARANRRI